MDKNLVSTRTSMHRWASLQSELLWIYEGSEQSKGKLVRADHRHGYWLWLLQQGTVSLQSQGEEKIARKGEWMLSSQAETSQMFSDDAKILSIHFRCHWPTGENLFEGTQTMVWSTKLFPSLEISAQALLRLGKRHFPQAKLDFYRRPAEFELFMKIRSKFDLFIAEFSKAMHAMGCNIYYPGICDERLVQIIESLQNGPFQEGFPWGHVMRESGMSRRHIDRLFLHDFGISVHSYWDNLRVKTGMHLLETTDFSIKEIAGQLGFKQAAHFSNWFKHKVGRRPKLHRQLGTRADAEGMCNV